MAVADRIQELLDELGGIEQKLKDLRHGTSRSAYQRAVNQQTYKDLVERQGQVRDEIAQLHRKNYDPFGVIRTENRYGIAEPDE